MHKLQCNVVGPPSPSRSERCSSRHRRIYAGSRRFLRTRMQAAGRMLREVSSFEDAGCPGFRPTRMQAAGDSAARGCRQLEVPPHGQPAAGSAVRGYMLLEVSPLVWFHRSWLQVAGGPPHADAGNWSSRSSWLPAAGGWFRAPALPVAGGSAVRGCRHLEVPPPEEVDSRRSLRPCIGRGDRPAKAGRPPTRHFLRVCGAFGTSISPSARCLRHITPGWRWWAKPG
eukprot:gene17531-biopygen20385